MKIAFVHDYIKEFGGAERVLEALSEIFPDAPIYTTIYLPEFLGPHRKRFENKGIRTSWLQYIPFKAKLISPLRLLSPFAFKSFNLSKFDVIIVSQTGAYFPNIVRKNQKPKTKNQKLITYTHTPPRYLYGYKTAREWKNNPIFLVLGELANHFLRMVDYNASKNVDYFIANSNEVASRIKKFYRREAIVVYPPVDINYSSNEVRSSRSARTIKKTYYLTGGRLARAKGTDIVIDAFLKLGYPLKVFGKGFAGFEEKLQLLIANRRSRVEFVGEVTDEEKFELMRGAKTFISASYDEDFGITPVEAMSVGTPVIAYKSGAVKETVIDGKTGILYDGNDSEQLIEAVKKFEKTKINPEDCIKQAHRFSKERFKKEIMNFIDTL